MVIKFSDLKEFLWGLIIITMALSFPLQVYVGNPYPSLLPYILVGFVFLITGSSYRTMRLSKEIMMPSNHIGLMIRIYLLLVFTQTIIQTFFGLISPYECFSVFILSFLFAFITIDFFIKILKKINLTFFVIYRIFIAVLFVYSRLISDREITVLKSAGLSPLALSKPVLLLGLVVTIIVIMIHIVLRGDGMIFVKIINCYVIM